tara:strand:- start:3176 stop:4942 length:1767 start_codon:yes stop_codon:yes gene_type:complete
MKVLPPTLMASIHSHLVSNGRSSSINELAAIAFSAESLLPQVLIDLVKVQCQRDPRFDVNDDSVSLAIWNKYKRNFDEVEYVAFDIETNGGRSGRHRIIEIGAVRFGDHIEDQQYSSFVACDDVIPKFVSRLTGITPEMLEGAAAIEEVLSEFSEFAQGAVPIAHNLIADMSYLNNEFLWLGQSPAFNDGIDTMELCSALLPEGSQIGLQAVLDYFEISRNVQHRAISDAKAVRNLWGKLQVVACDRGIVSIMELNRFIREKSDGLGMARKSRELARWASLNLPALPGVYIFRDSSSRVLYVGKSNSLQRRVRSHFTRSRRNPEKNEALIELTAAIDFELTGSDLSALIRELELIEEFSPPYNHQVNRHPSCRYVRLSEGPDYAVKCVRDTGKDNAVYSGPYRTGADARLVASGIASILHVIGGATGISLADVRALILELVIAGPKSAIQLLEASSAKSNDVKSLTKGLRSFKKWKYPIAGGLGGSRVVVVGHGVHPGCVELRLIVDGVILTLDKLHRPSKGQVRDVIKRSLEAPIERHQCSGSLVNLLLSWLYQNLKSDSVFVIDSGKHDLQATVNFVWRKVRLITR